MHGNDIINGFQLHKAARLRYFADMYSCVIRSLDIPALLGGVNLSTSTCYVL